MNTTTNRSRFQAFNISLDMIRAARECIVNIRAHDAELATQLRKAAASVPLNLAEGNRRVGRDKLNRFRIAAGSADEVRACLLVAEAWGYVTPGDIKDALELIDRLLAILWTITHKPARRRA